MAEVSTLPSIMVSFCPGPGATAYHESPGWIKIFMMVKGPPGCIMLGAQMMSLLWLIMCNFRA